MGLFFYSMICDPGTFETKYSCRQGTCIPDNHGDFGDLDMCQAALSTEKCPAVRTPAPAPALFRCIDGQCVAKDNGVDKDTCQA
eukprot:gene15498-835_t